MAISAMLHRASATTSDVISSSHVFFSPHSTENTTGVYLHTSMLASTQHCQSGLLPLKCSTAYDAALKMCYARRGGSQACIGVVCTMQCRSARTSPLSGRMTYKSYTSCKMPFRNFPNQFYSASVTWESATPLNASKLL